MFDLASNLGEGKLRTQVMGLINPVKGFETLLLFSMLLNVIGFDWWVLSVCILQDYRPISGQPRHTPSDGILVAYDARSAIGQNFMKDLNNGAYRKEFYVAHISEWPVLLLV